MDHVVIEPPSGWQFLRLKELWRYRELLWVLGARDIKVRYKQTVLGAAWALLQPLSAMLVFTLIFGRVAKLPSDGLPYPVFVYAGMLPWQLFSASVSNASSSVLSSSHLISKVYFPRLLLPLASVGAALVDFVVASSLLLVLMVVYDVAPTLNLLMLPVLVFTSLLCAVGAGSVLSGIAVRYRDFRYVVPFTLQLWMYGSPVVYASSMIPEKYRWFVELNPMAGLIEGFRCCFLGRPFDVDQLLFSFGISAALFVAGALVFSRTERALADII